MGWNYISILKLLYFIVIFIIFVLYSLWFIVLFCIFFILLNFIMCTFFPCMEFIIIYTINVMNFITMKSIESDFFSTMLTMRPDVVHYRYSCPVISHQYWWYGQEGMKQGQLLYHMFTMRPEQNWRHFTDNIFKCIFVRKKVRIFI